MTLTVDWSFSVLGVVAGGDSPYCPAGPIGGFGGAPIVSVEAPRGDRAGDVGGQDRHGPKTFAFPIVVKGIGCTRQERLRSAMPLAIDLMGAWGRAMSADTALQLRLPGFPGVSDTLTYYGRPRAPVGNLDGNRLGHIPMTLVFRCLDPYGYLPPVTQAAGTAENTGNVPTDRVIFTVTADIGGLGFTKQATGEAITFTSSIGVGATVNLRTGAVLDANGNDVSRRLAPGPLWFDLDPGVNTINVTGGQADVAVQSAYNI